MSTRITELLGTLSEELANQHEWRFDGHPVSGIRIEDSTITLDFPDGVTIEFQATEKPHKHNGPVIIDRSDGRLIGCNGCGDVHWVPKETMRKCPGCNEHKPYDPDIWGNIHVGGGTRYGCPECYKKMIKKLPS